MDAYRKLSSLDENIQHIVISWEGDYEFNENTLQQLLEIKNVISSFPDSFLGECGVYSIHSKICKNQICYIGYTYGDEYERCFIDRLKEHLNSEYIGECPIRALQPAYFKIGFITDIGQERISKQLLEEIEGLLIIVHQPTCNSMKKKSTVCREMTITNNGDYLPLMKRIDSRDY